MNSKLLIPFSSPYLGQLKNSIVMSAMTRGFADANHCCTDEIAAYYTRRAEGGVALILTEGIIVDPSGDGYCNVPHLYTDQHAASWVRTVKQVQQRARRFSHNSGIVAVFRTLTSPVVWSR